MRKCTHARLQMCAHCLHPSLCTYLHVGLAIAQLWTTLQQHFCVLHSLYFLNTLLVYTSIYSNIEMYLIDEHLNTPESFQLHCSYTNTGVYLRICVFFNLSFKPCRIKTQVWLNVRIVSAAKCCVVQPYSLLHPYL